MNQDARYFLCAAQDHGAPRQGFPYPVPGSTVSQPPRVFRKRTDHTKALPFCEGYKTRRHARERTKTRNDCAAKKYEITRIVQLTLILQLLLSRTPRYRSHALPLSYAGAAARDRSGTPADVARLGECARRSRRAVQRPGRTARRSSVLAFCYGSGFCWYS
jgi:hypothetical protein